jgi:nicotinate-nucleotide adenylyltransferase
MRLGIFGGSFDPVHNGHAELARSAQRQASLDEVWFTPADVQPLKSHGPHATDAQRLAMLELAMAGESSWHVCTLEIERGGVSYTIDTLRAIRAQRHDDELFFLLGADTLSDVPNWREPAEVLRLATLLVASRAGGPEPNLAVLESLLRRVGTAHQTNDDAGSSGGQCPPYAPRLIDMPAIDASSSDVRRRLAAGQPIDELVPPVVADYIAAHGLYR